MDSEKATRRDILLKMHDFYALEARQQRSMMWETVKWFTPVLVALHTAWLWIYITKSFDNPRTEIWLSLIAIATGGLALSVVCILILERFYRTDLIYITMFAKVEDELAFDKREEQRNAYPADNSITYRYYKEDRKKYKTADSYVWEALSRVRSMYFLMAIVFFVSGLGSVIEDIVIGPKILGEERMHTLLQIIAILLALAGTYFLAFGLKIEKQYSEDLIKELKLEEKGLMVMSDVSQKKRRYGWGLALLTLAAAFQILVIICY